MLTGGIQTRSVFFYIFGIHRTKKLCEQTQTLIPEFDSLQLLHQRKQTCVCSYGSSINSPSLDSWRDEDSRACFIKVVFRNPHLATVKHTRPIAALRAPPSPVWYWEGKKIFTHAASCRKAHFSNVGSLKRIQKPFVPHQQTKSFGTDVT